MRQTNQCENPHACYKTATWILEHIPDKWNPTADHHEDGLTLTRRRLTENRTAREQNNELTFNPSITIRDDLAPCFRIFCEQHATTTETINRKVFEIPDEELTVYTDGSAINNGYENAKAGGGIYYGENDPKNEAIRVYGPTQTNQAGEIAAIYKVAKTNVGLFAPLHIISDSRYAINGLTIHLEKWEKTGYIGKANKAYFQAAASWLKERGSRTGLKWIKGHSGDKGNDGADHKANQGANLPPEQASKPTINPKFHLTGAQISATTQKLIYQGIREEKTYLQRKTATEMLDRTRYAVEDLSGYLPSDEIIWKATQHKDTTRRIRDFIWKTMHGAYRVGKWWRNIPTMEQRAECQHCRVEDSMEHILTECDLPGQKHIWKTVEKIWLKKHKEWPRLTIGTILGSPLAKFTTNDGKRRAGANRLYRILITEAAHLIWKLRCDLVIGKGIEEENWYTENQLTAKLLATLNRRLTLDQAMTRSRFGTKALPRKIVLQTWSGIIEDEHELPTDWIGKVGVLVGIG